MAAVNLGEGLLMSSRASRTTAIMDAAMTNVEANRSCLRCSSSRAVARLISPTRVSPAQAIIGEVKAKVIHRSGSLPIPVPLRARTAAALVRWRHAPGAVPIETPRRCHGSHAVTSSTAFTASVTVCPRALPLVTTKLTDLCRWPR